MSRRSGCGAWQWYLLLAGTPPKVVDGFITVGWLALALLAVFLLFCLRALVFWWYAVKPGPIELLPLTDATGAGTGTPCDELTVTLRERLAAVTLYLPDASLGNAEPAGFLQTLRETSKERSSWATALDLLLDEPSRRWSRYLAGDGKLAAPESYPPNTAVFCRARAGLWRRVREDLDGGIEDLWTPISLPRQRSGEAAFVGLAQRSLRPAGSGGGPTAESTVGNDAAVATAWNRAEDQRLACPHDTPEVDGRARHALGRAHAALSVAYALEDPVRGQRLCSVHARAAAGAVSPSFDEDHLDPARDAANSAPS
jgi:hypothetical protein